MAITRPAPTIAAGDIVTLRPAVNAIAANTDYLHDAAEAHAYTNGGASAVALGALMIQDTSADTKLKPSLASAGQQGPFWVCKSALVAAGATGDFASTGYVVLQYTGTAPTRGQRLQASATAGVAQAGTTNPFATALAAGTGGTVIALLDGPTGGVTGAGTVTSVGLTVPAEFSVAGSPVVGAGTLAVSKATQSANLHYAGPASGAAAAPTFRALVLADLPAIVQTASALGTTSNPSTSSTTYVDMPEMTVTLTTSGGNLLVILSASVFTNVATVCDFALSLDGAAEVAVREWTPPAINLLTPVMLAHLFTGVAAGAHTVKGRWLITAGTSTLTARATERVLIVQEGKA